MTDVTSDNLDNSKKTYNKKKIIKDVFFFIMEIAIILFVFTQVVVVSHIVSGSMEPTLMTGDFQLISPLYYKICGVERGTKIAFWSDEFQENLSKRVIGVYGDSISFAEGHVYINGELYDESEYLSDDVKTYSDKTFYVPEGCVFVLGDNREFSEDSRFFINPYIPLDCIRGRQIGYICNPFK